MNNELHTIPRIAITSIATGLLMMAFFTTMWTGIACGSLKHGIILLILFGIIIITFISFAIYLFGISKRFPKLESETDKAEGKQAGKWFGIIFGAEGLGIFVAINIVVNLGHADLTIPVIALVVGLHFYPLAKIFKRTIDYYLATWTTVIAIIAIVLILKKVYPPANVDAFVGIGTAIATSGYGLYMIYVGRNLSKKVIQ
ncbi:hypothetical protein ACPPVU_01655 [Mucilaginibacter sp. McL0603]|uniref:hypothetical protein n=1 Tax=Mucilaginibacter sp. McL0603 TaxID=3415670 RepID=UPI003CF43198